MKSARIRTTALTAAAALSLPLSLGILAPQASADSMTPSPSDTMSASPSTSEKPFGPGCSSLPSSGDGSSAEMAKERVATAVEKNPKLSMLADAIKKTDLASTLNDLKGSTVFAPTNDAFNKLGTVKKNALLANKAELKKVLEYHVIKDKKITKSELAHGDFTTLEGGKLTTSGSGDSYKVNDKTPIACGGIATKNATVYLLDGVLIPPMMTTPSASTSPSS
ncbi:MULTISPECIES: fasciclin domain-containing protein [Streptomyces]|uniref:Fasciclin domain-containing protein n=1 Tax=Streptomyces doudnae TaxID=3075536 RepID=A0ABD5EUJ1_9ACTN|nr:MULTISPECIES: fasciclin domain-containing protein [unclassified Streptomyces]MDT0438306.1 fasciclin domain-containing protein [Streptomyces sp. DSM 41981]MYQ68329.1 fasciclin domain-containing protein [Streptomyces sp. SID4950]SCE45196.1 Uncaracterized surface protein containing fasciclin (FAS1) repeats [Streptomyces sp. SolWspMP-5a-2]